MLLHDTMLRDDSHRTATADTPVCECGHVREKLQNTSYWVVRDFTKLVIRWQIL